MKPDQQFINMIGLLYQSRQPQVTNLDLIKHTNQATAFYSISMITMRNGHAQSQTPPFSDRTIIEIDKGANHLNIIAEGIVTQYTRTSPLEYLDISGKGHVHWNVVNTNRQVFVAVKLMSPDGGVQIKLITADEVTQFVYNVCELPNHMKP